MVKSTRSKNRFPITEAIVRGLSPDGGLFVFESIDETFFNQSLVNDSYFTLSFKLFSSLLEGYDDDVIKQLLHKAYDDVFTPEEVMVTPLNEYGYTTLYHGPTFAFKDMALRVLPHLIEEAMKLYEIDRKLIILTATSGDTGSAALSGFSEMDDAYVFVLYPKVGVSEFQERQMNSFQSDHEFIYGINGNFDDAQHIVKRLFQETTVSNSIISSANSINIGRIIPQIVYYFYTYIKLVQKKQIKFGETIHMCVPSGNFGNIFAGYLAKRMGCPIDRLIIASNQNNVITDLFQTGHYNIDRELYKSISPSMDIIVPSNLERYFYYLFNEDESAVKHVMDQLYNDHDIYIPEILNQDDFVAYYATEEETKEMIKEEFEKHQIILDPHTAVGRHVVKQYKEDTHDNTYISIMSTASPYKFSDSVLEALDTSSTSLEDSIQKLNELDNIDFDTRILDVIKHNKEKRELDKEDAITILKRKLGEIDDSY